MKIMIYENSHGFAHYTYELCNAIVAYPQISEMTYLTCPNNRYIEKLDKKINCNTTLNVYDTKLKKNSLAWTYNRVKISLSNIVNRNRYVKKEKPDILSIQNTVPIIDQFLLPTIKKHTKIVLTVHDVIIPQKSKSWNKRSLKKIYKTVDNLIVHSEVNKKQLVDIFNVNPEKIRVIHHGVHTNYNRLDMSKCKKKIGVDNGKKTILFYGAIRDSKGLDILINALNNIECNLIIAGAMPFGENFNDYKKLIKEKSIDTREYIEFVSDDFSEILFQASDIIALPYVFFYSQSGVFMQSLQYRKPIIATDVSCFKEYIDKYKIGCICKKNNIQSLHEAIKEMINDENALLKYRDKAEFAVQENSWRQSGKLHVELFSKIKNR